MDAFDSLARYFDFLGPPWSVRIVSADVMDIQYELAAGKVLTRDQVNQDPGVFLRWVIDTIPSRIASEQAWGLDGNGKLVANQKGDPL